MVNKIRFNNFFYCLILILAIKCSLAEFISPGKFPLAKRLNNGRFIVVSNNGIFITDPTLTSFKKSYLLDAYEYIYTVYSTTIEQFPIKDDGYIVVIRRQNLYILSHDGEEMCYNGTFPSYINEKKYYSIIPYQHEGNNYYFWMIYTESIYNDPSSRIYYKNVCYNSDSKEVSIGSGDSFTASMTKGSFECKIMKDNDNEVIVCAYGQIKLNIQKFNLTTFKSLGNPVQQQIVTNTGSSNGIYTFKIEPISKEKNVSIACYSYKDDATAGNSNIKMRCAPYFPSNHSVGTFQNLSTQYCAMSHYGYYTQYFYETDEILVGCLSDQTSRIFYLSKFNKNLELTSLPPYELSNAISGCDSIKLVSIVFPSNQNSYNYLYDCGITGTGSYIPTNQTSTYPIPKEALNCEKNNKYYDYAQIDCIDEVPDGYFCNSTTDRTIDKCHTNCKTCSTSGTNEQNNCLTCPEENTIYYDLGNCLDECPNGYFEENSVKTCICSSNIACKLCSDKNTCDSCNNYSNFYPIEGDTSINCYNVTTIPENYYLDNDIFKLCYSKCASCSGRGDDNENNCIKCNSGYSFVFKNNEESSTNCYLDCNHYYYFSRSGEYVCSEVDECPGDYKLIYGKKKCITDCTQDKQYNSNYEYKDTCYSTCPEDTKISGNKCELDCTINDGKYFNYDRTECITVIEDGYYCNSTTQKTIDKCHDNCKTCKEGPTSDNNNCETCPITGNIFYDLGNCKATCENGNFVDTDGIKKCKCTSNIKCKICNINGQCKSCNTDSNYYPMEGDTSNTAEYINCYDSQNIPQNYYLDNAAGIYKLCYETCGKCSEGGSASENKCIECKSSSHFFSIDNNNIKNCYPICANYYYFDNSNIFKCLNKDECPEGYKLIYGKKKCIRDCNNDNEFNSKYEYNNICYSECPEDTKPSGNKCVLDCKTNNKFFNYEQTACITTIPEGYYINSTELNTINKCHINCKTCNEGGTDELNNCESCPSTVTIYYDLGNCISSCTYGHFTTENSIEVCQCSTNVTCKLCTIESNQQKLCESCNTNSGYHPMENDPRNKGKYINCYNGDTIPSNYLLDAGSSIYKPCYTTCASCSGFGDSDDNKCLSCRQGYSQIDTNCYPNCAHYFYFDDNLDFICLDEDKCPKDYKLIDGTKKCIKNCEDDDEYDSKYEYDGICYKICPGFSNSVSEGSFLCKLDCKSHNKYFNLQQTDCIDNIPEGYYCDNEELNTIKKCHDNCKTCKEGPTSDNNNCETCPITGNIFYDLGNCKETCENGNFVDTDGIKKCKCTSNIKCEKCDKESNTKNLCISCNNEEGYYIKSDDEEREDGFINCYKNPENYFLNDKKYDKCYTTCKYCTELGDDNDHKCLDCLQNYEFKNDFENDRNCYQKCEHYYYYDSNKNLICTSDDNCPEKYPKFVISKKKCIDDCKKDKNNMYEFKNKCYNEPPPNTRPSIEDNYILEEIIGNLEKEKCNLIEKELNIGKDKLTNDILNNYAYEYTMNYGALKNYVTKYENNYYKIFIYNNIQCLEDTSKDAPLVNFGECEKKVKTNFIIDSDLIIAIVIIKDYTNNIQNTTYAFVDPKRGNLLDIGDTCSEEKVEKKQDVIDFIQNLDLDDKKEEKMIHLVKQGINIFNPSDDFYQDLCYYYDSPNNKDIPMRDRASLYYPNITLCEAGCSENGVDLEEMKVNCICKFKNFMNKDYLNDNLYGQTINEFLEIINSLNIDVLKCLSKIFKAKYFRRCIGGFISLGLLVIQIICIFIFFKILKGFSMIKRHIYYLNEAFNKYKKKSVTFSFPPKKKNNSDKNIPNIIVSDIYDEDETNKKRSLKNKDKEGTKSQKGKVYKYEQTKTKTKNLKNSQYGKSKSSKRLIGNNYNLDTDEGKKEKNKDKKNKNEIEKKEEIDDYDEKEEEINLDKYIEIINGYLNPPFDENDYDDVVEKDKRTFCQYFTEKFIKNQIFINTFNINEVLRPRPLKIIVLTITLELYLVINALFYTEDYLNERYNSDEPESFFSFIPNRLNEFVYISSINGIIAVLIRYIFDNDENLQRILKKKSRKKNIKEKLGTFIKEIKYKFIILIVLSIITSLFSFFYLSCFNAVYPYIRGEWIKSSIFILILMQIINCIFTLLETCFRFLAIRFDSIRLFKLSELFE